MIRYPVSIRALLTEINNSAEQDWLIRARLRTKEFYRQSKYVEDKADFKPFWSELKPLYLNLQKNKCIYCERTLGDPVYALVEMDVEHYRPKRKVTAWPSRYMQGEYPHLTHYQHLWGDELASGYLPLAYHPLNMAVSCLRCNRRAKLAFFPIDAARVVSAERNLNAYHSESPDLFYPLSFVDPDDPQSCITFRGPFAFPSAHVSARARERARVTIDLLHLNQRSELIDERCRAIAAMYAAYKLSLSAENGARDEGMQLLDIFTADSAPHASCGRCYRRLCQIDIETASMFFHEALERLRM